MATSGDRLYLTTIVQVDITRIRDQVNHWLPDEAPSVEIDPLGWDLLPTWYDNWLIIERERQRQIRLHALERMSDWYVGAERFDSAIEAALQAIAGDPLRESAHRCLIRAHLAEGNVSEARRQVRKYEALLAGLRLASELGASNILVNSNTTVDTHVRTNVDQLECGQTSLRPSVLFQLISH